MPTLTFNIIKLCTYNTYFNIIFIEILTFVIRLKKYTLSNFTFLMFSFQFSSSQYSMETWIASYIRESGHE